MSLTNTFMGIRYASREKFLSAVAEEWLTDGHIDDLSYAFASDEAAQCLDQWIVWAEHDELAAAMAAYLYASDHAA